MKPKATPEGKTRQAILNVALAKGMDCYMQVYMLFDKYDKLIKNCSNAQEREHIGTMGIAEIHMLLDCYGDWVVNDKVIIPGEQSKKIELE